MACLIIAPRGHDEAVISFAAGCQDFDECFHRGAGVRPWSVAA
jgi:hypothetical protein